MGYARVVLTTNRTRLRALYFAFLILCTFGFVTLRRTHAVLAIGAAVAAVLPIATVWLLTSRMEPAKQAAADCDLDALERIAQKTKGSWWQADHHIFALAALTYLGARDRVEKIGTSMCTCGLENCYLDHVEIALVATAHVLDLVEAGKIDDARNALAAKERFRPNTKALHGIKEAGVAWERRYNILVAFVYGLRRRGRKRAPLDDAMIEKILIVWTRLAAAAPELRPMAHLTMATELARKGRREEAAALLAKVPEARPSSFLTIARNEVQALLDQVA